MKLKYTFLLAILVLVNLELAASDNGNSHDPRWRYRYRPAPMPFCGVPRVRVFIPPPPPPFVTTYVRINRPYRPNPAPAPVPIETQIRYYKEDIQNQKFESDKLRVAKEGAMDLPLYSVDVLDILNLFTYESSRLEFAKFTYNKVNDKDKFSIIYQAFKFDSSIRDLEDYIYNGR